MVLTGLNMQTHPEEQPRSSHLKSTGHEVKEPPLIIFKSVTAGGGMRESLQGEKGGYHFHISLLLKPVEAIALILLSAFGLLLYTPAGRCHLCALLPSKARGHGLAPSIQLPHCLCPSPSIPCSLSCTLRLSCSQSAPHARLPSRSVHLSLPSFHTHSVSVPLVSSPSVLCTLVPHFSLPFPLLLSACVAISCFVCVSLLCSIRLSPFYPSLSLPLSLCVGASFYLSPPV